MDTKTYPGQLGFYMPAEWYPHDCCWMQWPHEISGYTDVPTWSNFDVEKGRVAWSNVAKAISNFENVKMIVNPADVQSAKVLLKDKVQIIELSIDDGWARDSGAIFLLNQKKELAGVDWKFNGWGKFRPFDNDDRVAMEMIKHAQAEYFNSTMVLEGGSIHVDGQGTLLTTEQCLLNKNRNPNLTKQEIEENLRNYLGVQKIIWLKHGIDEGTDGHIDAVACFARPGVVIAMVCRDKQDPFYDRLNENLECLRSATDSQGRNLEIIELEMSYKRLIKGSDEPTSYINFFIANNGIVFPLYGDAKFDKNAELVIKSTFPNHKVHVVEGLDIHMGGGNVHCITQQQPKKG